MLKARMTEENNHCHYSLAEKPSGTFFLFYNKIQAP
jgi:hypothetical protein